MQAYEFEKATGRKPDQDDLERVNCNQAGEIGHISCGWCHKCDGPCFQCLCGVELFNERTRVLEGHDK